MTLRWALPASLFVLLSAGSGEAADYVGRIIAELRAQGFGEVEVQRTLLGRARIMAERNGGQREIVLNPVTGEILRDFSESDDDDMLLSPGPSGDAGTGIDRSDGKDSDDGNDGNGDGDGNGGGGGGGGGEGGGDGGDGGDGPDD